MRQGVDDREVHLWYLRVHDAEEAWLPAYTRLLSEAERGRAARFRFARDSQLYQLSKVLLRTLLSRYADVSPLHWRFRTDGHGKPRVAGPRGAPPLEFNLSHTRGLIACVIALGRRVGVDVENTRRPVDFREIADRYLSPSEFASLTGLPDQEQRRRFFMYWTLKESFLKALGVGLSSDPSQFSFHLNGGAIAVSFEGALREEPAAWQFCAFRPTPEHSAGLSVERGWGSNIHILIREALLPEDRLV